MKDRFLATWWYHDSGVRHRYGDTAEEAMRRAQEAVATTDQRDRADYELDTVGDPTSGPWRSGADDILCAASDVSQPGQPPSASMPSNESEKMKESMHRYESAIAASGPTKTVVRLCERGTDETLAFVVLDGRLTFAQAQQDATVQLMVDDLPTNAYYLAVL